MPSTTAYLAHIFEVVVSDGHIVQVLDVAKDPPFHPGRLFAEELETGVRVDRQNQLVKEILLEFISSILRYFRLDVDRTRAGTALRMT